MQQTNPIQQRVVLLAEQWEAAKVKKDARIVRLHCQADEVDMVDAFYTYMIGADTPVEDIAFHFDSLFTDAEAYSTALLKELAELIAIWNQSEKDERIEFVAVDWQPDYSLKDAKNPAALFVCNFNKLAQSLGLPKGFFAVAVLKPVYKNKAFTSWASQAIAAGISPGVRFLIDDSVNDASLAPLANRHPGIVLTVPINLDMPKALEQAAAMGDPNEPSTGYRVAFIKMMNAMEARKEAAAEQWAKECIAIAQGLLAKDPYWAMQLVVVYTALANDKMGYKKKRETFAYAQQAVEAATAAQPYLDAGMAPLLVAQTLMFRGTLHFVDKAWQQAYDDYEPCFGIYRDKSNYALAIEAARMGAQSAFKQGQRSKGLVLLAAAVRTGHQLDPETARASTFAGAVELLIDNHYKAYLPPEELESICRRLYGEDWASVVRSWKKPPNPEIAKEARVALAAKDS
jgi:hypothetical protein